VHCSTIGTHHLEKSHGSDSEAPTYIGWGFPTVHIDWRPRSRMGASRHYSWTTLRGTCQQRSHPRVRWTGGHGTTTGQSSLSQAQGFCGRATQIRVIQDESQVSLGGLLALDQVLRILGHVWPIFGTSIGCRRQSTRRSGHHEISTPFFRYFWVLDLCNEYGNVGPWVLPMLRSFL